MSRARKTKRASKKPTGFTPTLRDVSTLEVAERRLQRACDLMSCLEYCQDAELNLGSLALAARDLLDRVIEDLVPLRRDIEQGVQPWGAHTQPSTWLRMSQSTWKRSAGAAA